jgi:hypothetical protein
LKFWRKSLRKRRFFIKNNGDVRAISNEEDNREQNRKTRKAISNGGRYAGNEQLAVSNEQ